MDYKNVFVNMGLQPNDCVYVASSSISMLWNSDFVRDMYESLTNYFTKGTIVMPAFSSDFRINGYFNPEESVSFCGLIAEYFRKSPDVYRTTLSPLHTVCCKGLYAKDILQLNAKTSFGSTSVFEFLKNINATILLIDCSFFDGVPFINALEEKYQVPYRYWKTLTGEVESNNSKELLSIDWFAKCIDYVPKGHVPFPSDLRCKRLTKLGNDFYQSESVKIAKFNKTKFVTFKLHDFYNYFEPKLTLDINAFIRDS